MNLVRRLGRTLCAPALLVSAALALAAPFAQAQQWPTKAVRVVVAGPPGGSADIVARILADNLTKEIGQPVIVEAKPGGAGIIAVNDLSQAPHDGYTVLVGVNSLVSEIPHIVKMKFDMAQEIKPVAELSRSGLVLVANPSFPAKNLAELVAYVKANPGKVNYASYSPGTISHVLGLQLNKAASIDMTHVGYKGSTPALTDVMGGHVPLMFDGVATSLPYIKSGKLKAFAVSSPKRSPLLPDVPTFAELGYPEFTAKVWFGLLVKEGTPPDVLKRLTDAAIAAHADPDIRKKLEAQGFEVPAETGPQLKTEILAQVVRWGKLVQASGFSAEDRGSTK